MLSDLITTATSTYQNVTGLDMIAIVDWYSTGILQTFIGVFSGAMLGFAPYLAALIAMAAVVGFGIAVTYYFFSFGERPTRR